MATAALVPLSEYLSTSYEPDCDFVDGVLEPRPMSEKPHSILQGLFYSLFDRNLVNWRLLPLLEQRVQTAARNYRVPDLCLVPFGGGEDRIIRKPPFLCIEILSPEDTLPRTMARAEEYLRMGVPHVWVVDPVRRTAFTVSVEGAQQADDVLAIPGTSVAVRLEEIFSDLAFRLAL